jgi:hypothetical protein
MQLGHVASWPVDSASCVADVNAGSAVPTLWIRAGLAVVYEVAARILEGWIGWQPVADGSAAHELVGVNPQQACQAERLHRLLCRQKCN